VNSFFSDSCTPPAVVEDALQGLEQADRRGLLHDDRRVAGPERAHQEVGLRLLMAAMCEVKSVHAELGEELEHEFTSGR